MLMAEKKNIQTRCQQQKKVIQKCLCRVRTKNNKVNDKMAEAVNTRNVHYYLVVEVETHLHFYSCFSSATWEICFKT